MCVCVCVCVFESVCSAGVAVGCHTEGPSEVQRANLPGHAHACTITSVCGTMWSPGGRWPFFFMRVWKKERPYSARNKMSSENGDKGRQFVKLVVFWWMWEMGPEQQESCHVSYLGPSSAIKVEWTRSFFKSHEVVNLVMWRSYSQLIRPPRGSVSRQRLCLFARGFHAHTHTHTHTHTHMHQQHLPVRALNTSYTQKLWSYVFYHLFFSLCACLSLSLSLPLPLSLYLSGAAMTCLGFAVSVCIVSEAIRPPTSDLWCIFLSNISLCWSGPKKESWLTLIFDVCWCVPVCACVRVCKFQSAGVVMRSPLQ